MFLGENKNTFEFRCSKRDKCQCKGSISVEKKENPKKSFEELLLGKELKIVFNNKHTCHLNTNQSMIEDRKDSSPRTGSDPPYTNAKVQKPKQDNKMIEQYIYQYPLYGLMKVWNFAVQNDINISKAKIKNLIFQIRNELFPTMIEEAISDYFCITKDNESQFFCQGRSKIRIFNKEKKAFIMEEFIIFGSQYMLRHLKQKTTWYLDGTFKIVPPCFYQLVTILVYSEIHEFEVPACYILLSGKNETLYQSAFYSLKNICSSMNINLAPQRIMTDFEKGLRNALVKVFPEVILLGCFFHMSKAIWMRASKLGLRSGNHIYDTKILILFFKIIIHLPFEDRESVFSEIKSKFILAPKSFTYLINYFKKNWLNSYYINPEDYDDSRFSRTNNVSERYNFRYIVNLAHPRLSILVAALLEEEAFYKKIGLNLYSQNSMTTNLKIFDVPDKNDMKEKLTFSEFLVYLRSMDKSPEKIKKMIINDSEIEK